MEKPKDSPKRAVARKSTGKSRLSAPNSSMNDITLPLPSVSNEKKFSGQISSTTLPFISEVSQRSKLRTSKVSKENLEENSEDSDDNPSDDDTRMNIQSNRRSDRIRMAEVISSDNAKQDILDLVNRTVYYILVADQKKYAIKKSDILKTVFQKQSTKCFTQVLSKANTILQETFGMEILDIDSKPGEYILSNLLEEESREFIEYSPFELQKQGFIFFILAMIFMNEQSINEQKLWESLKFVGIYVESPDPHPIFGDVRKYVTVELVKKMYLRYELVSKDPPEYEFRWGPRANNEITKKDILNFICREYYKDTKPENWIIQYRDANENEDQN